MLLVWLSRCMPGFTIIALVILLSLAFPDVITIPAWYCLVPSTWSLFAESESSLTLAQKVFVVYSVLIHLNMFGFTVRLSYSLFRVLGEAKRVRRRRGEHCVNEFSEKRVGRFVDSLPLGGYKGELEVSRLRSIGSRDEYQGEEVVHAIILPNYAEDGDTLRTTLNVLASHPRARSQYEIYIAMEQKEAGAPGKAAMILSVFEKSFLRIRTTFHPAGTPGEVAGKGSNVAFAAHNIIQTHRANLSKYSCNVIITVMDADTHLSQDYFTEIRRLHYTDDNKSERSFYCCPIMFDRNSHETPVMVRCADLLWGFAGLSTMYPGTALSIPTSVYSLPLSLADRVGGWDSDPTAIGEDMHMFLKCYFETAGNVVNRVVYVPASHCNVSSDTGVGWQRSMDTCCPRYRQALRHMWGALDSGFAARRSVSYFRFHSRCLFLRPRHLLLLHMLWEAHCLPCHLTILMVFCTIYELCTPTSRLNPSMAWTFWFTGLLRTASFIWMNICLALYERWHAFCARSRRQDMLAANLTETGYSERKWWRAKHLLERICFPIAGTVYGAVPTMHAVFSHFWTDRLDYRVSKKPGFAAGVQV